MSVDIEIRREGADLVWASGLAPAIAEIAVPVGPGVEVIVDAGDTSQVLSWRIEEGADPSALARACTDSTVADAVSRASTGAGDATLDSVTLTPSWARKALVLAVERWSTRSLDEAVLVLDEAAAEQRTGNSLAAGRLVALGSSVLEQLGTDCVEGDLTGGAAAELVDVSRFAAQAVEQTGWGHDIADIAAAVQAYSASDDTLVGAWIEMELDAIFGDLMVATDYSTEVAAPVDKIDPASIPARILRWRGPDTFEIYARYRNDLDCVEVTVELSAGVSADCFEANQLVAYAADSSSGKLLASGPMSGAGGQVLMARLPLSESHVRTALFGVYSTEVTAPVRIDPVSRTLLQVDRLMLQAWDCHRAAVTVVHLADVHSGDAELEAANRARTRFLRAAQSATDEALDELQQLVDEFLEEDPTIAGLLQARLEAIGRFGTSLQAGGSPVVGAHPLLAELLSAGYEDDE